MEINETTSRRGFMAHTAATAAGMSAAANTISAPASAQPRGANDRIRVGFIGMGFRGSQLLPLFMANRDVEIAALCDVYEPFITRDFSQVHKKFVDELGNYIPRMGEGLSDKVARYTDFRRLLDRKDIDAVVISTPDHWHAVQAIMAMESGKDVFVEKPLTLTIKEGRAMVEAARRTKRVAQVGLTRRGSPVYRELAPLVRKGLIGKVTIARAFRITNMYPDGIGVENPTDPPDNLDWDLWLGPQAYRPFQWNIHPYRYRWFKDYSSQMGNWGVHFLDLIRWLIGEQAPVAISAHGGKYVLRDDRTIPDTMETIFEFPSGALALFSIHEACDGPLIPTGLMEFQGTLGTLYANDRGYQIEPSRNGQFQHREELLEPVEKRLEFEDGTVSLVRNFLDCIKSRGKCWVDLEEGHRSTTFAHLANIALTTGSRIAWDPVRERITNNEAANKLLHYEYRAPWKLG
ncbi:MAG: Gfo/Idh/MocA family protein [Candidatus Latescibacterota bacterium]